MAEAGPVETTVKSREREKKGLRFSWRALLRALHRDLGHLLVGFTLIYAISGLAVNHIADWDPSFVNYEIRHELGAPLTGTDDEIAKAVSTRLHVEEPTRDVYRMGPDRLEVVFDKRTLHVDTASGVVVDEGQKPRFFLRVANWLHLNRGKKAWTIMADTYAVGLILLALSGILFTPFRKGLFGRGGLLLLCGVLIPLIYVELSGGPSAPVQPSPTGTSRMSFPPQNQNATVRLNKRTISIPSPPPSSIRHRPVSTSMHCMAAIDARGGPRQKHVLDTKGVREASSGERSRLRAGPVRLAGHPRRAAVLSTGH